MTTYRVPVHFQDEPDTNRLSDIASALGDNARQGMNIATGENATSEGADPTFFYVVIDDPMASGVATSEVTGQRAAQAVMSQALLDCGYTTASTRIDTDTIAPVG
jgi:hypothetical protein